MQRTVDQLRAAIQAVAALPILEWRKGYGESGSLHVGALSTERQGRAARQRGAWIITVWEARVRLTRSDTESVMEHPPLALNDLALEQFVGRTVESTDVTDAGALILHLSSQARIEVFPEADIPMDADQWVLETPDLGTFIVRSGPVVLQEQQSLSDVPEPDP